MPASYPETIARALAERPPLAPVETRRLRPVGERTRPRAAATVRLAMSIWIRRATISRECRLQLPRPRRTTPPSPRVTGRAAGGLRVAPLQGGPSDRCAAPAIAVAPIPACGPQSAADPARSLRGKSEPPACDLQHWHLGPIRPSDQAGLGEVSLALTTSCAEQVSAHFDKSRYLRHPRHQLITPGNWYHPPVRAL